MLVSYSHVVMTSASLNTACSNLFSLLSFPQDYLSFDGVSVFPKVKEYPLFYLDESGVSMFFELLAVSVKLNPAELRDVLEVCSRSEPRTDFCVTAPTSSPPPSLFVI